MSKQNKLVLIIVIVAVLSLTTFLIFGGSDDSTSNTVNSTNNETNDVNPVTQDEIAQEGVTSFTIEEVAQKNTEEECWTVIDGNVYDITSYIPRHPGGDEILLACGVDGSSLFNERTTNSGENIGSGTSHSSSAANQLKSLFIGSVQ